MDASFRDPEIEPGIGIGLKQNSSNLVRKLDRGGIVCIATCYEQDGPGNESQQRREFLHPSRPALDLAQFPY
jgi:hypothetical protein